MANDFINPSRSTVLSILDVLANSFPRGSKRAALDVVKKWILENIPQDVDEETEKRILEAFEQCRQESEMILPEIIEPATEYVEGLDE